MAQAQKQGRGHNDLVEPELVGQKQTPSPFGKGVGGDDSELGGDQWALPSPEMSAVVYACWGLTQGQFAAPLGNGKKLTLLD